jgi:hypothetical protein
MQAQVAVPQTNHTRSPSRRSPPLKTLVISTRSPPPQTIVISTEGGALAAAVERPPHFAGPRQKHGRPTRESRNQPTSKGNSAKDRGCSPLFLNSKYRFMMIHDLFMTLVTMSPEINVLSPCRGPVDVSVISSK